MALTQINRPDSQKALFGTGSDLEIYHDGSHSYIDHSGTGSLFIKGDAATTLQTDTFTVKNYGGSETFLVGTGNGAIELYYNNEKTLQTTASGAEVFNQDGNAVLSIIGNEGNAAQLYLKSDDGDDNADVWRMHADASGNLLIENYASGSYESNIKCVGNGTVELYYDNTKRFETYDSGCKVIGHLIADNIYLQDSEKINLGNSDDLQIYFDGESRVKNVGTSSSLYLQTHRGGLINEAASEWGVLFTENDAVKIFFDGVKKFETTSLGTTVTGYQLQTAVPAFRAGRQASALSVDAGDAIIFDVTNMGGGFNQGSHYNTSTGRFTAPVAGVYHFHACVIYQDLGTGGTVDMEDVFKVYVNSTQISFAERRAKYTVDGTGSSGYYTDHFSLTTSLSANDYIWLRQDKDSRVIHNNNTYSHFSGHLVG